MTKKGATGETPKKERPKSEPKFVLNETFPDAAELFSFSAAPLSEEFANCLVVLDTNVLLDPYRLKEKPLNDIIKVYEQIVEEKRLVVPGQVAREFAKNRAAKISDILHALGDTKSQITSIKNDAPPLVAAMPEFAEYAKLRDEANESISKCQKAMGELIDKLREWTLNDPVSTQYRSLFPSIVYEPNIDLAEAEKEFEWRVKHQVPPGFKDSNKPDGGIGDFLIWKTILDLASRTRPLLFVTGEEKADWVHTAHKVVVCPRYELVDEYRRKSGGCAFYIAPLAKFLELAGAEPNTVEQVRETEAIETGGQIELFDADIATYLKQLIYLLSNHDRRPYPDELLYLLKITTARFDRLRVESSRGRSEQKRFVMLSSKGQNLRDNLFKQDSMNEAGYAAYLFDVKVWAKQALEFVTSST